MSAGLQVDMLQWGSERRVDLLFIEPGKPTQSAKIESLNGKIRDELLNAHTFATMKRLETLPMLGKGIATRRARIHRLAA